MMIMIMTTLAIKTKKMMMMTPLKESWRDNENVYGDDNAKDGNGEDGDETCKVSTVTILTTLRKADMLIALGTGGDGLMIIIISILMIFMIIIMINDQ